MLELVLNSRQFIVVKETKKSFFCKYQIEPNQNKADFIHDVKELGKTYPSKIFNVNTKNYTIIIDK